MKEALEEILETCQAAYADDPGRPDNTCPDIDEALKILRDLENDIDDAIDRLNDANAENPFGRTARQNDPTIAKLNGVLEDLRKKNSALRVNGTHYYEVVEAIEKQAAEALEPATP